MVRDMELLEEEFHYYVIKGGTVVCNSPLQEETDPKRGLSFLFTENVTTLYLALRSPNFNSKGKVPTV